MKNDGKTNERQGLKLCATNQKFDTEQNKKRIYGNSENKGKITLKGKG